MKLDREKLNLILAASDAKDEDSGQILIRRSGEYEEDAGWMFLPSEEGKKFYGMSAQDEHGDFTTKEMDMETFLEKVQGIEVDLLTNWNFKTGYERFSDWDSFAKSYGALDLEVLSTKVPRPVARYFKRFAEKEEGVSAELRKLVYSYVEKKLREKATSIMFQE